ncbi:MAG: hypothetical protein A4E49_01341 [Methanosaeta sp. PtaU1.Bin112]|nr:MAG: hypothetical protein A4E49_01341 [Methanosaeta sp. PtaU1.Bin112]
MRRKAVSVILPLLAVLMMINTGAAQPNIPYPFNPDIIEQFIPDNIDQFFPDDVSQFVPDDMSPYTPRDISLLIPKDASPLNPKKAAGFEMVIIQGKVTSISQSGNFRIDIYAVLRGYGLSGTYPGFSLVPGATVETTATYSSYSGIRVGDCVEVSGKWWPKDSPPIYLGDSGSYIKKIICPDSQEPSNPKMENCIRSGGRVTVDMCCKSTPDFPNTCVIGPCGCSPDNSKETKVCDCGEGRCFDGTSCVGLQDHDPTPTCAPGPTGNCRCLDGAIWSEFQKEDCTKEWIISEDCKSRGPNWKCLRHGIYPGCECVETIKTPCDEIKCSKQSQPIGEPRFDKCGNKIQVYSVCECKDSGCDCSGREERITKRKNRQPNQPTLLGPGGKLTSQSGQKGVAVVFTVWAKDPDGDLITYKINWGDGTTSQLGPVASETTMSDSHIWKRSGNFRVEAKAIDQCGAESYASCYIDMSIWGS